MNTTSSRPDPHSKVLSDAISKFLDSSHRQAGHDPDAISRLEKENEFLREAVAALQDHVEHALASQHQQQGAGDAVAALQDLQERLEAAEDGVVDVARQVQDLDGRVNSLEAAREGNHNDKTPGALFPVFFCLISIRSLNRLEKDIEGNPIG